MIRFLAQTLRDYHHVGAIAPSSRSLARALAASLGERPESPGMRVLEVGPGTGALTRGILEKLQPGDRLVLCEISASFVQILQERFREDPEFQPWRHSVDIIQVPIEDMPVESPFHHIVCGLPFNNFAPEVVRSIFDKFRALLYPGGTVNFFEYIAIRRMKLAVVGSVQRAQIKAVEAVLTELIRKYQVRQKAVWWNCPPAWARTLRF